MSNRLNTPNDLRAFWMPFTANRQFKKEPRMFVGAKDMHYTTHDGRTVLDGTAGLWCVNAGHCRPKITEAIQAQPIDPPTLSMRFAVNDSPMAGREGTKVTSRMIRDRLLRDMPAGADIRDEGQRPG